MYIHHVYSVLLRLLSADVVVNFAPQRKIVFLINNVSLLLRPKQQQQKCRHRKGDHSLAAKPSPAAVRGRI